MTTPSIEKKECKHNFEFVRTEIIQSISTTGNNPYQSVDLVICTRCGKTKRV